MLGDWKCKERCTELVDGKVQGTQRLHLGGTTLPALHGGGERERTNGGEQAKHLGDKQHQTHQDTCRATDSATPIL